MHDLISHLRFAIRQLRRNPGFSLTAILTLAIGIGATTAIFSIFYAVLLKPLPYPQPERLVSIVPLTATPSAGGIAENELSYPNFNDWRDQARTLDSIASYHTQPMILNAVAANAARNLQVGVVSSDFFSVLRMGPALGRNFTRDEEKAGSRVVILSHELWASSFGSSPTILGQAVQLSDELYTVVGVLPEGATFPFVAPLPMEAWTTPAVDAIGKNSSYVQRGWNQLGAIARLKAGVTAAQAQAEMILIQRGLAARYPDEDANQTGARVTASLTEMVGNVRPALNILFAAVAALLLIACANVAGLLLARGSGRQAELAVRAALGASRSEITLQLLSESLLLSLVGGAAGVLVASLTIRGIAAFLPKSLPRLDNIAINAPVLAFAVGVSVLTGILFGLLPARRLSRLDPALALRDGTRTSTAGRGQHRLHSALVVTETALGLILLVGAGLLIRSFQHLVATDPGFNPKQLLTFRVGLSDKTYPEEKRTQFFDQLLTRLAALPGVKSVTAAYPMPFSGGGLELTFTIQGRPTKPGNEPDARASVVEPGYFQTLEISLLQGRLFTAQDNQATAPPVAVINEAMAQKFFPNEEAIGKRIQTGFDQSDDPKLPGRWREIVGVVPNVKRTHLSEPPTPEYYVPLGQAPIAPPSLAMRVSGDPASYANAVGVAVASLDKQVPVYRVRTLDESLTNSAAQPRFQTLLLTAFAAIALLLSAIGLYAILSYIVVQRTHEIGLRMALGAQRSNVLRLILNRGLALALIGVAFGIGLSALLTRFLSSQLYGVRALDPLTFVSVAAVLLLVSALASLVPATRAASLDPMRTLRDQ